MVAKKTPEDDENQRAKGSAVLAVLAAETTKCLEVSLAYELCQCSYCQLCANVFTANAMVCAMGARAVVGKPEAMNELRSFLAEIRKKYPAE